MNTHATMSEIEKAMDQAAQEFAENVVPFKAGTATAVTLPDIERIAAKHRMAAATYEQRATDAEIRMRKQEEAFDEEAARMKEDYERKVRELEESRRVAREQAMEEAERNRKLAASCKAALAELEG